MPGALFADTDKADPDGVARLVGPGVAGDDVWQRNCGPRGGLEKSATIRFHGNQPATDVMKILIEPEHSVNPALGRLFADAI